jgi:hypothetical protein
MSLRKTERCVDSRETRSYDAAMRRTSLLLCSFLCACGGESTNDTGANGGGGSSTGGTSSGGTSTGGTSSGGSSTGGASTGGTGGTDECASLATLNPTPVGFETPPELLGDKTVVSVTATALETSAGTLRWSGPDLTGKFTVGESVVVGIEDGWHYVEGVSNVAAAYYDFGFVTELDIPDPPAAGPSLVYASQCTFQESPGACGSAPGTGQVYAVEATTGAGALVIQVGETKSLVGWEITNVGNGQYPGYGNDECHVEAAFAGSITALGPSTLGGK